MLIPSFDSSRTARRACARWERLGENLREHANMAVAKLQGLQDELMKRFREY